MNTLRKIIAKAKKVEAADIGEQIFKKLSRRCMGRWSWREYESAARLSPEKYKALMKYMRANKKRISETIFERIEMLRPKLKGDKRSH